MPTTYILFFSSQTLFTPWPASFLPSLSTFTSDFYFMEFGTEVKLQQCCQHQVLQEKKIQRNLTTKKKYINKKVQKRGGIVISFGVRWLQIQYLAGSLSGENVRGALLGKPRPFKQSQGPCGTVLSLNSQARGLRSEDSRRLSRAAQEGRGPVMGAGRGKDQTKHQPPCGPVPGNAGGTGTELKRKPGEAGVLVWGSWGRLRCEREEESGGRNSAGPLKGKEWLR